MEPLLPLYPKEELNGVLQNSLNRKKLYTAWKKQYFLDEESGEKNEDINSLISLSSLVLSQDTLLAESTQKPQGIGYC